MMTPAMRRRHLGRIAAMPCLLCELLGIEQTARTTVHHIREGQGMSQRANDYLAVPLCESCHQGSSGIHGDRSLLRIAKTTELDLLAETIARLTHDH